MVLIRDARWIVCWFAGALVAALPLVSQDFEPLYREALALREARSGAESAEAALSRLDLALYLVEQGGEAEPLLEQAYRTLEEAGVEPERRAAALEAWAGLRLGQGDGKGAAALLRKAASLRPLGPARAATLGRLAELTRLQGDPEEAARLYRLALESGRSGEVLRGLAVTLEELGAYDEAERAHEQALEAQRRELGDLDPQVALTLNSLGLLAAQRGDSTLARERLREALRVFEGALGPRSAEAATALDNLGNVARQAGDYPDAERSLTRALAIRRAALGAGHPDTAMTLNNLGGLYHVEGRLDEAEALYRESVEARRAAFGAGDAVAAETLYNLGHLLRQKGDVEGARETFAEALGVLEQAYGTDDPFVGELRKSLEGVAPAGRSGSSP